MNIFAIHDVTPDQELASEEAARRVRQIISEMPENVRGILILAYYEQFSYRHIAGILNIPLGTIKSRLHNNAFVHFRKKWIEIDKCLN